MIKIDRPEFSVEAVFDACKKRVFKGSYNQSDFDSIDQEIKEAEQLYIAMKEKGSLFTLIDRYYIKDVETNEKLNFLYKNRLTHKNDPGREYYNTIKKSSRLCPMCGKRQIGAIDHFLPKALFPHFSIVPVNLIPICNDCNKAKSDDFPRNLEEEYLHPYFDDQINSHNWLKAELVFDKEPFFIFTVNKDCQDLSAIDLKRIEYQFNKLNLDSLYNNEATSEYFDRVYHWEDLLEVGNEDLKGTIRKELSSLMKNKRSPSYWRIAMYQCLLENEEFLKGVYFNTRLEKV